VFCIFCRTPQLTDDTFVRVVANSECKRAVGTTVETQTLNSNWVWGDQWSMTCSDFIVRTTLFTQGRRPSDPSPHPCETLLPCFLTKGEGANFKNVSFLCSTRYIKTTKRLNQKIYIQKVLSSITYYMYTSIDMLIFQNFVCCWSLSRLT
jgi:hypothetical protein